MRMFAGSFPSVKTVGRSIVSLSLLLLVSLQINCPWDGVDEGSVDEFTQSWYSKAQEQQRQLQYDIPVNQATWMYTHNAYNAEAYQKFGNIRYLFPNQIHSLKSQLKMGIRILELDIHYYLSTKFKKEILLCHGQSNHVGCVVWDRRFTEGLAEIRDFLNTPENKDQIVMLLLEEYLDGKEERTLNEINEYLGDKLWRPVDHGEVGKSGGPKATAREILAAGKNVIIQGHTSAAAHGGNWGDYIYNKFVESVDGNTAIKDFKGYPDCDTPARRSQYNSKFVRVSSDATNYLGFYDGSKEVGVVSPEQVPDLMKCDVNAVGFDNVEVDHMKASVWSWQENRPSAGSSDCAALGSSNRWDNKTCSDENHFACKGSGNADWKVTSSKGNWDQGIVACYNEFGNEYRFAVPISAYQNQKLAEARNTADAGTVWLNYSDRAADTKWVVGAQAGVDLEDGPDVAGLTVSLSAENASAISGAAVSAWDSEGSTISLSSSGNTFYYPSAINGMPGIGVSASTTFTSGAEASLAGLGSPTYIVAGKDGATSYIADGAGIATYGDVAIDGNGVLTLSNFDGFIGEVLIYSTNLGAADLKEVRCYLADKYSISESGCD